MARLTLLLAMLVVLLGHAMAARPAPGDIARQLTTTTAQAGYT